MDCSCLCGFSMQWLLNEDFLLLLINSLLISTSTLCSKDLDFSSWRWVLRRASVYTWLYELMLSSQFQLFSFSLPGRSLALRFSLIRDNLGYVQNWTSVAFVSLALSEGFEMFVLGSKGVLITGPYILPGHKFLCFTISPCLVLFGVALGTNHNSQSEFWILV